MLAHQVDEFAQFIDHPGRDGEVELAGALELGVDAVADESLLDAVEVGRSHGLQRVELIGKPFESVGIAVGEARGAEAAVATGGRPADGVRLQQHDVSRGVVLLRLQRRPQTGVAAADDDQIRRLAADERRLRIGRGGVVEPEHRRLGVGECGGGWARHVRIVGVGKRHRDDSTSL